MQRLLILELDNVRAAGIVAENVVLAIVDAVMGFTVEMRQTEKRLTRINILQQKFRITPKIELVIIIFDCLPD